MNEPASIMKKEIRLIASYQALITSKHFLTIVLFVEALYLGLKRYAMSPLYILILLNILPYVLTYAFKDYANKYNIRLLNMITEDRDFKLKHLKSKYKYSKVSSFANSVSYLISLLLILLWQLNYNRTMTSHTFLVITPLIVLTVGVSFRLLAYIYYHLKLPYDLNHNKL